MKARTFKRPEDLVDYLYEKFFKWKEVLTDLLRTKDKSSTHINELYSIKQEYMKAEFVNSFVGGRTFLLQIALEIFHILRLHAEDGQRFKKLNMLRRFHTCVQLTRTLQTTFIPFQSNAASE